MIPAALHIEIAATQTTDCDMLDVRGEYFGVWPYLYAEQEEV
jgi:hypothetical protein